MIETNKADPSLADAFAEQVDNNNTEVLDPFILDDVEENDDNIDDLDLNDYEETESVVLVDEQSPLIEEVVIEESYEYNPEID